MNAIKQPIRWGIIGCGEVTEVKSGPAYQLTEGFELVAVMRRTEAKAKDYAQRHQVPKYTSHAEELIHDPEIDAVYIATPPDTHKHFGIQVAEAGKIACIEKPLAPSYADSLAIVNAFKQNGVPLFVAYYRRSLPRFLKIKEWIESKKIGEVRHLEWQLCKPPNAIDLSKRYQWRTDAVIAPGGYFDDLASHGLDFFTYLFGSVIHASGISLNQQKLYSAKDAVTGVWQHHNGITGMGNWNFGSANAVDKVQIFGSKGRIEFSVFEENSLLLEIKGRIETVRIPHPKHVQQPYVEHIRDHLFDPNKTHPSMGDSALHTSWVMDQILSI